MAPKDNLTAVLHGINDIRLEQKPIPKPKDNQVLLQMEVIGICGSDVHYLVNGEIGPFVVDKPITIGHEASGTVLEVGKNVTTLKPGDRVALEPGVGCRMCSYCKLGHYHLCPDVTFFAAPPANGILSRFFVHDADFCFKLPDNMSLEEGTLMEPLAVAVHTCKRAEVTFGSVVLVLGAGTIGLVTILAAKAMGATKIIVTDRVEYRLKKAKDVGADYVLNVKNLSEEEVVEKIRNLDMEPDISIDCTGAETFIRVAFHVTRTGGVVTLVGMGTFEVNVPLASAITREIDIRGIFRYCNDYPMAIEMVRSGRVNVKPLISHHYKIEDTKAAFQRAISGEGNPIKILIHANPNWKP